MASVYSTSAKYSFMNTSCVNFTARLEDENRVTVGRKKKILVKPND